MLSTFNHKLFPGRMLLITTGLVILLVSIGWLIVITPLYTIGVLLGALIIGLILYNPIIGFYGIILLSPFESLAYDMGGFGIKPAQLIFVITFLSWLLRLIFKREKFRGIELVLPFSLSILSMVLSWINAKLRIDAIESTFFYISEYCMIFLAINLIRTKRYIKQTAFVVIVTIVSTACLALIRVLNPGLLPILFTTPLTYRAATFANPNIFAAFLLYGIPFALFSSVEKSKPIISRVICFLLLLTLIMNFFLTASRSGIIGFVLIIVLSLYYKDISKITIQKIVLFLFPGIILSSFLFGYVLPGTNLMQIIQGKLLSINRYSSGGISFWSHAVLYRAAFNMLTNHPIIGVGLKNFGVALMSIEYFHSPDLFMVLVEDPTTYPAHSAWLGILSETGLLGMIAFLWIIKKLFDIKDIIKILPSNERLYLFASWMGSFGLLVSSVFYSSDRVVFYWLFVGLTFSFNYAAISANDETTESGRL